MRHTLNITSGERRPPEELRLFKIVSLLSMSSVDGVFGIVLRNNITTIYLPSAIVILKEYIQSCKNTQVIY